jgi:hypothetical protein
LIPRFQTWENRRRGLLARNGNDGETRELEAKDVG